MDEVSACHIFAQLAQGLRDMHNARLAHRDLKLLNIFMCDASDRPRVKIGDLGLSARLSEGETITKRAGTVAFMAPEVLLEQPSDFKADIWSLGIILYTLICSHLPFPSQLYQDQNEQKLLELEIEYEDEAFQQVNPSCVELLKGMLKKDPNDRWNIFDVLSHPWTTEALS